MQVFRKHVKSYSPRVVLIMLLMVGILLIVLAWIRLLDFNQYQRSLMKNAVHAEAGELAAKIVRLKDQVALFAEEHYDIINYLAGYPADEDVRQYLESRVARKFPEYFAISIADLEGKPYFENFDLLVNEICQQDLGQYVKDGHKYDIYIHPHDDVYHFDIMAPWGRREGDTSYPEKGVFFISFRTSYIAESLAKSEVAGHRLMLLRSDLKNLIEVSSLGGRNEIPGLDGEYFLSEVTSATIPYREKVVGSRWELVVLPDMNIHRSKLIDVIMESLLLMISITAVSLISLNIIRQAERRRNASEQNLKTAKEHLQQALDFSRVVQCDWSIDLDTMQWSDNASDIFNDELPKSFSDYLQYVHKDDVERFREDIDECLRTGNAYHNEHRLFCSPDRICWIEVSGNFERDNETGHTRMVSLVTDISNRKLAEQRRIEAEQQQRKMLVREVHHRIKNNLQGVVGLLRQHASETSETDSILNDAITQVHSISAIYGLQGDAADGEINLHKLIKEIVSVTENITTRAISKTIQESCKQGVILAEEKAVAVALVLNELLVNAVKHGANMDASPVSLSLQCNDSIAIVEIKNIHRGGVEFDFASGEGLGTGLTLLRSLLPKKGAMLTFVFNENSITARLELTRPVLLDKG